jgi:purine-nucleoside phosphorylase
VTPEDLLGAYPEDAKTVGDLTASPPRVAVVLGSGLDGAVEAIERRQDIPYSELTGMRGTGVAGHAGMLSVGEIGGCGVACFRGRLHRYQGHSAIEVAYPARLAAAIGATTLVVTNAAGSVDPTLPAGALMLIADHINLTGDNPLVGWPGPPGGTPFVPMGDAYDPSLRAVAREVAAEIGVELAEGVYAGLLGPSYETPAEVAYLRGIGANAVGMSTVTEVIAARALGLRMLGISSITNAAGGAALSHAEVLEVGARSGRNLARLLVAIIGRL